MRLLVSCTSGLTSSYFAYTMKNALGKAGIEVIIDAAGFTEIDRPRSSMTIFCWRRRSDIS